ncbi:MAG: ABC transporter substrate-binding protein [Chloroflexota bacterium]
MPQNRPTKDSTGHDVTRTSPLTRRQFLLRSVFASTALALTAAGCSQPTAAPAPATATKAPVPATSAAAPATTAAATKAATAAAAATQAPAKTGTKIKLRYWHPWGAARIPLMDAQVKSFQEKYPDIEVEHQYVVIADLTVKILTAVSGGDPPEVINLRRAEMPSFVDKGALMPLDDYLKRDKIDLNAVAYPSEAYHCAYNGVNYSLPQAIGGGFFLLYYNKDTYQKAGLDPNAPPKTWKELAAHDAKLTKVTDGKIASLGTDIHQATDESYGFDGWLYTNGGKLVTDDGKGPAFNSAQGLETLQWMVDFHKAVGGWGKVRDFTGGNNTDPGKFRPMFYDGLVAIYNHNVSDPFIFQSERPDLKWGAGLIPYNDANAQAKSTSYDLGGWGTSIPKGAKNADAAWEFVKWNTVGPGNDAFMRAQARPSPIKAFTEAYGKDPNVTKINPSWDVFVQTLANTVPIPKITIWARLRDILQKRVEQALLGQMSAKDALAGAEEEVKREFARA